MAEDLLIKVGLGGAKEMLAEMAAIRDQANGMLKGMQTEAAKAQGAFSSLRQEFPALDSAVKLATNPLVLMTAAVAGTVAVFGKGVAAASEFNHEFLALQNLNLDKSAEDISGLKSEILDLSLDSGRSAKEVSKAFFDIQSGTGLFGEEVSAITSKLADFSTATKTDMTAAVGGAIKAIRAFNLDVEDMDAFLASSFATVQVGITTFDELAKVQTEYAGAAAASGQSVDDANKLFAAFTATAKDSAQAANLTKTAFQDLTKKATVDGFKSVGVSVFDVTGKMKSVDAIVTELVPKLKTMSAEEFSVLKENIGGSEGIRGLLDQAKSQGDALIETFRAFDGATENFDIEKLLENAKGDFETLKNIVGNQVNTVMIQLGEAILPVLARALDGISQLIPKITGFFRENAEVLKVVGKVVAGIVAAYATYRVAAAAATAATTAYATAQKLMTLTSQKLGEGIFGVIKQMRALVIFMAANPLGAIAIGIAAVAAAFVLFGEQSQAAADSAKVFGESIKTLRNDTDKLIVSVTDFTKGLDAQLEAIKSGSVSKDTVIAQIDSQLEAAKLQATKAREEIEKAKQAALNSNLGGLALSTDQIAAENELETVQQQIKLLEDARSKVAVANREFLASTGLGVNSLALLAKNSKDVSAELEKVGINSEAFKRLGLRAKEAADELAKAREELTLIQNAGGSVDEISNRLNVMTSRLNKAEMGPEFAKIAAEVKALSAELATAKNRVDAFIETGGQLKEIQSQGFDVPGPTQTDPTAQSLEEFAKGIEITKVTEFQKGFANLRDEIVETGKAMTDLGVRAFGDLATGIGKAIAQGGRIADVFKQIGRTLAVEAPKLLGTALLNAATTAQPWPLALGLAAAGAALMGLSGFAAGKFEQADLNGNSGVGTGTSGTGVSDQVTQDLGTFSDQDLGTGPNIQIFMDGKEIAGIVKNRIDILNELQIGN